MRYNLGKPKAVAGGDLVTIKASLPRSAHERDRARLGVYTRVGEWPFSPHTDTALLDIVKDGRPSMVSPMFTTLHEKRRTFVFEFTADEAMDVVVVQEKDASTELSANIRIIRSGKTAQAFRRFCRNAIRSFRRTTEVRPEGA